MHTHLAAWQISLLNESMDVDSIARLRSIRTIVLRRLIILKQMHLIVSKNHKNTKEVAILLGRACHFTVKFIDRCFV